MFLHGIIGEIFSGANQHAAAGDECEIVLGERFVIQWSSSGELPQGFAVAKCCCGIVKLDAEFFPHFHGVVNIVNEWKEFIEACEVYQRYLLVGSVMAVIL